MNSLKTFIEETNMLKRIAFVLIATAIMSACSSEPKPRVVSYLHTTNAQGIDQAWSLGCDEHGYACNKNTIRNARIMPMGDGMYYMCGLDGQLYVGKQSYKAMSSLTPLTGVSCTFNVGIEPPK